MTSEKESVLRKFEALYMRIDDAHILACDVLTKLKHQKLIRGMSEIEANIKIIQDKMFKLGCQL